MTCRETIERFVKSDNNEPARLMSYNESYVRATIKKLKLTDKVAIKTHEGSIFIVRRDLLDQ